MNYYPAGTSNAGHYGAAHQYQGVHGPVYHHHAQGTVPISYTSEQSVSESPSIGCLLRSTPHLLRHATFIISLELTLSGPRDITLVQTFIGLLRGPNTTPIIQPFKCPR